tara:strand:- start:255 stop:449 length:195 start_codon:yes stop_codon:yes gene_type:complete
MMVEPLVQQLIKDMMVVETRDVQVVGVTLLAVAVVLVVLVKTLQTVVNQVEAVQVVLPQSLVLQ